MSPERQDLAFIEKTQLIIDAMGVPVIEKNEDRAYYSPSKHCIVVPPRHKFHSDKAFFAVVLHELSHSTSKALNREMHHSFGSLGYAKEELIAETSTMFLCLEEGLETFNAHARYLESWCSHFADKKKGLLSVCKQAKQAQQYISDKVEEHKLKLVQQAQYRLPEHLEHHVALSDHLQAELNDFIDGQSKSFGLMIPLKNQHIIGVNKLDKGVAVYTDEKCINVYGPAATALQKKLSELEMKQSLSIESMLDIEPDFAPTQKPRKTNGLSI